MEKLIKKKKRKNSRAWAISKVAAMSNIVTQQLNHQLGENIKLFTIVHNLHGSSPFLILITQIFTFWNI